MKVLNICSLLPLEGLERENDIILRLQDHLARRYGYDFKIAKSLPYVNAPLARVRRKWRVYYEYQSRAFVEVGGYPTLVYPWLSLPTARFSVNYLLLPFNRVFFTRLYRRFAPWVEEADLILAQYPIPDGAAACWLSGKFGKPYVVTVRRPYTGFQASLLEEVFARAAAVVTPSPANYRNLKPRMEITFIPHPVDEIFFGGDTEKTFDVPRLVSVCRLLKLKHLDWVISVLGSLSREYPRFEYHVAGDGPERRSLEALVRRYGLEGKVFFHGHLPREKVRDLLASSHVFVMPSYPETLGRAFLEAAACGCVCVGHKGTGVDGILVHGESGFFVDKNSLRPVMETILRDFSPAFLAPYAAKARLAVRDFTWDEVCGKYHEVYTRAAE